MGLMAGFVFVLGCARPKPLAVNSGTKKNLVLGKFYDVKDFPSSCNTTQLDGSLLVKCPSDDGSFAQAAYNLKKGQLDSIIWEFPVKSGQSLVDVTNKSLAWMGMPSLDLHYLPAMAKILQIIDGPLVIGLDGTPSTYVELLFSKKWFGVVKRLKSTETRIVSRLAISPRDFGQLGVVFWPMGVSEQALQALPFCESSPLSHNFVVCRVEIDRYPAAIVIYLNQDGKNQGFDLFMAPMDDFRLSRIKETRSAQVALSRQVFEKICKNNANSDSEQSLFQNEDEKGIVSCSNRLYFLRPDTTRNSLSISYRPSMQLISSEKSSSETENYTKKAEGEKNSELIKKIGLTALVDTASLSSIQGAIKKNYPKAKCLLASWRPVLECDKLPVLGKQMPVLFFFSKAGELKTIEVLIVPATQPQLITGVKKLTSTLQAPWKFLNKQLGPMAFSTDENQVPIALNNVIDRAKKQDFEEQTIDIVPKNQPDNVLLNVSPQKYGWNKTAYIVRLDIFLD